MNKIKMKDDDKLNFPEHSFFKFLEEKCYLDENKQVLSEEITDAFNEYMGETGYFSSKFVISMTLKIVKNLKKASIIVVEDNEGKRRRTLKGIALKENTEK